MAIRRVYLDQNQWIALGRAVHETGGGERFADARLLLEEGVRRGEVSLPLSSAHYMELSHRRNWRSRRQLGETMLAFSELHTIAPQEKLLPGEIDGAIQSCFGAVTTRPRPVRPFGQGASHAFGFEIGPYHLPAELHPHVRDVAAFERKANDMLEQHLLVGPTPEQEEDGIPGYEPFAHLEIGERYAEAREDLRDLRKAHGWHKGERAQRVAMAQALTDCQVPIEEAMSRAGVPFDALLAGGREGMTAFLAAIPTMFACAELERQREISSQKAWERQDLTDLGALSVAIAHCDIVVTERMWTDAVRRSKLDERLGTIVIARLDDLPEHILA